LLNSADFDLAGDVGRTRYAQRKIVGLRRTAKGQIAIAVLLWVSPLANPPSVFPFGLATPILIVLFVLRLRHCGSLPASKTLNPSLTPAE
jgi:hypothetical protein